MFKVNEGKADRAFRAVLAVALAEISYGWLFGWWRIAAYVVAALVLITAMTGYCGLYTLMHWNTNTAKKNSKK